jgi:hypothetical protein
MAVATMVVAAATTVVEATDVVEDLSNNGLAHSADHYRGRD